MLRSFPIENGSLLVLSRLFLLGLQEIKEDAMEKGTAYMLFYEREGLSMSDYLPKIDSQHLPDTRDLEDELEVDFKKHCSLM